MIVNIIALSHTIRTWCGHYSCMAEVPQGGWGSLKARGYPSPKVSGDPLRKEGSL